MPKEIDNLDSVQGVNFEFIDSLKSNCTKYLLICDKSCEENCILKTFVGVATSGRHREFIPVQIKPNLFHQSNFGREVELQNTHIVLFNSPRYVMQLSTLSSQLGIESELVDF